MEFFYSTLIGRFLTQAFLHSMMACLLVELGIYLWQIHEPLYRQRLYFLVIILPMLSMPIYDLLTPARQTIQFRLGALFDSTQWLYIRIIDGIDLSLPFLMILILTSGLFLFQEILPIIRNISTPPEKEFSIEPYTSNPSLKTLLQKATRRDVKIFIIKEEDYIVFSNIINPSIFISEGLLKRLSEAQLKAIVAHEMAHLLRNARPVLILVYIFRCILFFNPVVLIHFRKAVEEEEKICDDLAVEWTGSAETLAETLEKFYLVEEQRSIKQIQEFSDTFLIKNRIQRLRRRDDKRTLLFWPKFILIAGTITFINYWIV